MKALIAATLLILAGVTASAGLECHKSTRLESISLSLAETGPGAISGVFVQGGLEIEFQGLQTESLTGRRYEIPNETITAVEVYEEVVPPKKPTCPRCPPYFESTSTKATAFVNGKMIKFHSCSGAL